MTSRTAGERVPATSPSQTDVVIHQIKRLVLEGVLGPAVRLVDSAPAIARRTADLLRRDGLRAEAGRQGSFALLTTGDPRAVASVVARLWGREVPVEAVEI